AGAFRCRASAAGFRSRPRKTRADRTIAATAPRSGPAPGGKAAGPHGWPDSTRGKSQTSENGLSRVPGTERLASGLKISMVRPAITAGASPVRAEAQPPNHRGRSVRVIACSLRKGNIVEIDGKLYAVLNAENFHPGKRTPRTQVDLRRISDGVKTQQRYKTTEQVERAHVEDHEFSYLYQDGDGFHFMNSETYDQVAVSSDVIGDQAPFLQEGMKVKLSIHEGIAVSIELPPRVTLEVVDTEPSMKGQTASGSFKPAKLSNGARTMVPTHITVGTRVIVSTADGAYVDRAKD